MGPRNIETSHHRRPLRPLAWAKPALIRDSVPHPTKNCVLGGILFLPETVHKEVFVASRAILESGSL